MDFNPNRRISNKEVRLAKLVNHILHFTNRHSFFDIRYSLSLFNIRYSHRFFLRSRCSLRQNDGIVRGSMGGMRRHQFSSWRVNRSDEWLRNLKPAHQHNARPVILNEQPTGILLMIKFRSAANEESVVAWVSGKARYSFIWKFVIR